MTTRDRLVAMGLAVLAILALAYLGLVSPERKQAAQVSAQTQAARGDLASAQSKLAQTRTAQRSYQDAYAAVVRLGEAVPAGQEVSSLLYELNHLSGSQGVDFTSITSSAGSTSSGTPTAATPTVFSQMPFTFVFNGSFFDLHGLLNRLDGLTKLTGTGAIEVSGRLLTIQSIDLATAATASSGKSSEELTSTVTATAYVLPTGQSVTDGATAAGPATSAGASVTSTAPPTPSAATPAVIGPTR